MRNSLNRAAAATLVVLSAVSLGACAPAGLVQSFIGQSSCSAGPMTFTVTDTSGSTRAERTRGGLYEEAEMSAAEQTAKKCGDLYATTADGNSLSDSRWTIDDVKFRRTIGSAETSEAARVQEAKKLRRPIRRLLGETATAGTDVLGALARVALATTAAHAGRTVQIIVQSDGVLNVPGEYDLYETPIDTPGRRASLIARLEAEGELPDLKGAEVSLYGVGVGVGDRRLAKSVVVLWSELVAHMNGRLVSLDAATPSA